MQLLPQVWAAALEPCAMVRCQERPTSLSQLHAGSVPVARQVTHYFLDNFFRFGQSIMPSPAGRDCVCELKRYFWLSCHNVLTSRAYLTEARF